MGRGLANAAPPQEPHPALVLQLQFSASIYCITSLWIENCGSDPGLKRCRATNSDWSKPPCETQPLKTVGKIFGHWSYNSSFGLLTWYLTLAMRLAIKNSQLGFRITKKFCTELVGAVLWLFLNMIGAQEATVRSSVGAPEVVWRVVKHRRIILKLAKFYARVDSYSQMPPK